MTRFEPGSVRTGRAVRGERVPAATGYSHRGTGRSIDDVRGRGREALAATRGATALALSPAVAPPRRGSQPAEPTQPTRRPAREEPARETDKGASGSRATGDRVAAGRPATGRPATAYERIRTAGPARKPVTEPEPQSRP